MKTSATSTLGLVNCERNDELLMFAAWCSKTINASQGRISGIRAKPNFSKSGSDVRLAVLEARKHWQAVTDTNGTAMYGAHPAWSMLTILSCGGLFVVFQPTRRRAFRTHQSAL